MSKAALSAAAVRSSGVNSGGESIRSGEPFDKVPASIRVDWALAEQAELARKLQVLGVSQGEVMSLPAQRSVFKLQGDVLFAAPRSAVLEDLAGSLLPLPAIALLLCRQPLCIYLPVVVFPTSLQRGRQRRRPGRLRSPPQ